MFDSIVKLDSGVKKRCNSVMAGIRQFDENETLDRAAEVFWRQGYGATSMLHLAAATGVQRGSLYNAYGDKEAIFLLAYGRYRERFLAAARASLRAARIEDALRDFFDGIVRSMTEGAPESRGCLTTKTATDETATAPAVREALRGMLDDLEAVLEERLSQDDARGRLRLPPRDAARLLVTLTRGLVVMERVYHDPGRLAGIAASAIGLLAAEPGPAT